MQENIEKYTKIRAVVLYILNHFPTGIDYIKLFKILYFAQQLHLVRYGRVIINDEFQARQYGPVSDYIRRSLKTIESEGLLPEESKGFWEGINILSANPQIISADIEADKDELSGSEIKCLDEFIIKFKDLDSKKVSDISHKDKAWKTAYERSKKDPGLWTMTILEIAEAGNASEYTLAYIKNNIELDHLLN